MSSGKVHDQTTWMGAIALGVLVGVLTRYNWQYVGLAIAGTLFGGLMFSPDLDIKSKPWRRWGLLRFIWYPYQKWVPHRSWLSHSPIIGTLFKLLYLGIPIAIAAFLMGVKVDLETAKQVALSLNVWLFMAGVELGSCTHLFMDWLSSRSR